MTEKQKRFPIVTDTLKKTLSIGDCSLMTSFIKTNCSDLGDHVELVKLISEESTLLEKETSPDIIKRHTRILGFLLELQSKTSKELI